MAIVLAGGGNSRFRSFADTPVALLPLGHATPLDLILEKIAETQSFDQVRVTVDPYYRNQFRSWIAEKDFEPIEIIVEPRTIRGNLDAVKALEVATRDVCDDCLVVPCNVIFSASLVPILSFFKTAKSPIVALRELQRRKEIYSSLEVRTDEKARLTVTIERSLQIRLNLVQTDLFLFPAETIRMVRQYVSEGWGSGSLRRFIEWLRNMVPIHSYLLKGHWLDIHDPETYLEALGKVYH